MDQKGAAAWDAQVSQQHAQAQLGLILDANKYNEIALRERVIILLVTNRGFMDPFPESLVEEAEKVVTYIKNGALS